MRSVLNWLMAVQSTLILGGCVIPPRLDFDADAGVNTAPVIVEENTFPRPGPLSVYQANPGETITTPFNIAIKDPDKQPLTAQVFLDGKYGQKVPISNNQTPGGAVNQGLFFNIDGLCDDLVDSPDGKHFLDLYVTDGTFVASGDDLRQVTVGSGWDSVNWVVTCNAPVPKADGGT